MRRMLRVAKRVHKSAAHYHVTRMVNFAEETRVALDGSAGIDGGARRENRGHGRFG
jgi:hypothetical protein